MFELLAVPIDGLTFRERFCLLRLVNKYRKGALIEKSMLALGEEFGVKEHVVRKVLVGYLLPLGCVKKERGDADSGSHLPAKGGRTGRPASHFLVESEALEELLGSRLRGVVEPSDTHDELITQLITGSKAAHLSLGERLLLSVFLKHADPCGVVRSLSKADIRKLSGLKQAVLALILRESKYILSITPGGVGTGIFGRVKSAYFLDLEGLLRDFCPDSPLGEQLKVYSMSAEEIKDVFNSIAKVAEKVCVYRRLLKVAKLRYEQEGDPKKLERLSCKVSEIQANLDRCSRQLFGGYCHYGIDEIAPIFAGPNMPTQTNRLLWQGLVEQLACELIISESAAANPVTAPSLINLKERLLPRVLPTKTSIADSEPESEESETFRDQLAVLLSRCQNLVALIMKNGAALEACEMSSDESGRRKYLKSCEHISCVSIAGYRLNDKERKIYVLTGCGK